MKTYSRRNSRPISRSGKKGSGIGLLLSPSTPSSTPENTGTPGTACSSGGGGQGGGSTSTSRATAATWEEGATYDQQTPSSSAPAAPTSAAAVTLEKKRRRLSLASVPVCSLSKLPSPALTPSSASSAAGVFGRPISGSTGGDSSSSSRSRSRSSSAGLGEAGGGGGSPSVLGVRRLWGAGDSLSVGRKRRCASF